MSQNEHLFVKKIAFFTLISQLHSLHMVINIKNKNNMKNIKILGRSMTNKNKNKKGFTLIELLVVVAIIGALAAVGVVAYNGYIGAARENSTKSIHNGVAKFIANEAAKCALNEDAKIMGGDIECTSTTAEIISALAGGDVLQDKDPYDGGLAVVSTAPDKARGNVVLAADDDGDTQQVKLTTCYDKDCTSDATLSTTVQVFE